MKISTFGDSLTQGRGGWRHEFTYQDLAGKISSAQNKI